MLKLWPNPAAEQIFVEIPDQRSSIIDIKVYDSYGRQLNARIKDAPKTLYYSEPDISLLSNGLYFVEVSTTDFAQRMKLIIAKK